MAEHRERRRRNDAAVERIRRKPHPDFNDFLGEDDPLGVLWPFMLAITFPGDKSRENLAALSPHARIVYLAEVLDGEVLNGGFSQFFSNSSGNHAHETLAALHELGATRAAGLLQRAIDTFPDGRVPHERGKRCDALEKSNDAVLDALDTEFYTLEKTTGEVLSERIIAFMSKHGAERVIA